MDNPDRGAAFVVLKTAKVPSILIELGYITNAEDAQQLKSDQWRDKVSGSIVTAVDNYSHSAPAVADVSRSGGVSRTHPAERRRARPRCRRRQWSCA